MKKFALRKETLRKLDADEMKRVEGGKPFETLETSGTVTISRLQAADQA